MQRIVYGKLDGKDVHTPLFVSLFTLAGEHVKAYHSDLGHDALMLSLLRPGERMIWAIRESGTHMAKLAPDENALEAARRIAGYSTPHLAFYCVKVTGIRSERWADGTIQRLEV